MHIGVVGPVHIPSLKNYINWEENLPKGLGGTAVTQLVIGFLEKGYSISVFTLDKRVKDSRIITGNNLKIFIGPYRNSAKLRSVDFFRKEKKILEEFINVSKPDVISAHWTYEFAQASLRTNIPTLITIRDWAPIISKLNPDYYRFIRLIMDYYTIRKGNNFIANSVYIQENFYNKYKINISLIPNSISDSLFTKSVKTKNKEPQIISINNDFGNLKNVKTLIKAFKLIKKEIPDATLKLIGKGYEKGGAAEIWSREMGLSNGINFEGYIEHADIFKVLESTDLLIHPSIEESFGNILIEAMSQKVPVIAGRHSGAVPWVLNNGKAGILTDINSPEEISREAISVLKDKKRWRKFSENGYDHTWAKFRLSKIVDKYLRKLDLINNY